MSLALATVVLAAETPKFTPDQCRVLQQIGVDTRGICPQRPMKKKRKQQ